MTTGEEMYVLDASDLERCEVSFYGFIARAIMLCIWLISFFFNICRAALTAPDRRVCCPLHACVPLMAQSRRQLHVQCTCFFPTETVQMPMPKVAASWTK